ncbi:amidohydrolase family protein [Paraburkholderia sp. ZP32-5]|uniref:amidohydrolase family protein n=1 Tax=Paraburkholderia sp. ZP32-5 TaxID=2883245 RepID=UPI001F3E3B7E|nr:amidohydrolase family protein [Paraburkholderia sp. ZP32-5]
MASIDCHAHVFTRALSFVSERRYTVDYDADETQYLDNLARNGISRGVLVQPSFLGTDNSFMVESLRRHPDRLRGIAVVEPGVSADVLDQLAADGVVGIRLNLIGRPLPDWRDPAWRSLLDAVAARDWQIEIHSHAIDLKRIVPAILDAGVKVVVDHFGRPDPELGVDDAGFRYLLSLAGSGRVWVKLSGAYRNGPHGDQVAMAATPLLREAFGLQRLVWGSDWPHTMFEQTISYDDTVQQLHRWLPDEQERRIVLSETPAKLFGWHDEGSAA